MSASKVVIVSDYPDLRLSLELLVTEAGLDVATANSQQLWFPAVGSAPACCVVFDVPQGGLRAPDQIARFSVVCASYPVLALAEAGDVSTAVLAIKQGAKDVVQKPINNRLILERIKLISAVWQ
ncbi:MAG: response regulator [Halioglobus sp.]|nr:response regulator [Halioglobus sp.]